MFKPLVCCKIYVLPCKTAKLWPEHHTLVQVDTVETEHMRLWQWVARNYALNKKYALNSECAFNRKSLGIEGGAIYHVRYLPRFWPGLQWIKSYCTLSRVYLVDITSCYNSSLPSLTLIPWELVQPLPFRSLELRHLNDRCPNDHVTYVC